MGRPLVFGEHLFFAIVATDLLAINLLAVEVWLSGRLPADAQIVLLNAE